MRVLEADVHRGGFGRIDKVVRDDGSIAARKTFDPLPGVVPVGEIAKLRKRFCREVRIQQNLSADLFLPVYEHDLEGASPWFVMPWAERSYVEQIKEDRKAGNVSAAPLADILNGLEVLHSLGYVHRDLKPQNVLLHDGRWKLSDFGLALPPQGTTTKLTSIDSAWGTTEYAAPEQRMNFGSVGPAADIYAFGCILHDVFGTGARIPFQRHSCPGPLAPVVEKCTEVAAAKRFKSINGLRSVLLSLLAQPLNSQPSMEVEGWAKELADTAAWDTKKLEEFARFVGSHDSAMSMWSIFSLFNEETVKRLSTIDADLWLPVGLAYCDWVKQGSFDFAYCDVLAVRMVSVFENTLSLELRSAVALALAEMASSHNRWFAMNKLIELCGASLDDQVAARVAIEIRAEEAEYEFRRCASVIHLKLDAYHARIAQVLDNSAAAVAS